MGVYNLMFDRKPAATDSDALAAWRDRKNTHVRVMARATSAVMATFTVLFTYLIGMLLFSRSTGLLAAFFLAASPYFVLIAHFSTVDTAANFWYWLACLLSLVAWKRGLRPWHALAAFTVGLAAGTKLDHLLAVIPIVTSLFLRETLLGTRLRLLLRSAGLIVAGYVAANPTLLFSFFEFVDGTTTDLVFATLRGSGEASYFAMLREIATGMGVPLFTVSLAALAYSAVRRENRREFAWLLSAVVPVYLVFGSRFYLPWYTVFVYPALALIAAQGCVSLKRAFPQQRTTVAIAVGAIAAWSLLRSIAVDQQFTNDSRYAAAAWIEARVPRGAVIDLSARGPALPDGVYEVGRMAIPREYYGNVVEWRSNFETSRLYQTVHDALFHLGQVSATMFGTGAKQPSYRAWFDRVVSAPPAVTPNVVGEGAPDYVVLVDYLDEARITKLEAANSGYRMAARFHYRQPLGLQTPFSFVNPITYVFERAAAAPRVGQGQG